MMRMKDAGAMAGGLQQALSPPSPAPSPLCSASVSSFSVPLPGVAQQQPNTDSCGPYWEPGTNQGPSKSHPEATGHLCVGWSSRDLCALLTPPSSCNKGSPLSFLSAWVLLRVVSCSVLITVLWYFTPSQFSSCPRYG